MSRKLRNSKSLYRRNLTYLLFYVSVLVHVSFFLYFRQPIMSHIFPLVSFNILQPIYPYILSFSVTSEEG